MITKSIPNMFTIGNLALGMIALILALNGKYSMAAIMIIIAMLLDGLDGRVARALHVQSEFGKELDSLSDVISFGAAPALLMYMVTLQSMPESIAWTATVIFPICGAIRLARFNVRAGTTGYFIGLPIPAAGGVLATLSLFHNEISGTYMIIIMLLLSYLMVSRVKYPNFKKVGLPKKAVLGAPIVIVIAVAIAVIFPEQISKLIFIPLVIYAIYGVKQNIETALRRRRHKKKEEDPLHLDN
ncbi:CDP-diacylglycerol--serine O-phosphatidyltransferase [Paenibacillus crassostreae]|uniref:CDP-diacylglycerol--serine O-phosphatidyltransferase n=1 Tax=Paenibacillus crassostreae TaxID=1763538 RepID=A0A162KWQ2_9BACL|nr:CDP-diacylglycerol--serine O-phosphatidyltransferase [Paenibacillus crassostreae]AOZ93331.1 CDP-diacylglycerol--serine O-phosphatidyltransferase [Paenibacillus crassostreae]OAB75193.1 CDP-diacylglycerol--serine O-phosphatidyltransferase [Paenibacillus crassostreae]